MLWGIQIVENINAQKNHLRVNLFEFWYRGLLRAYECLHLWENFRRVMDNRIKNLAYFSTRNLTYMQFFHNIQFLCIFWRLLTNEPYHLDQEDKNAKWLSTNNKESTLNLILLNIILESNTVSSIQVILRKKGTSFQSWLYFLTAIFMWVKLINLYVC